MPRNVELPTAPTQTSKQRRQQRPAQDDHDGVDVLHPLRRDFDTPHAEADVVHREELQPEKLREYVAYSRNRSWATDVAVLCRTVLAVLFPAGAGKVSLSASRKSGS